MSGFVSAMRDESIMSEEFSFYSVAKQQYDGRFNGLCNGGGLMVILYTLQAMLGYGDDSYAQPFQDISLDAFSSILPLSSIDEIVKYNPNLKRKYNHPYIEADTYFPCAYHLTMLAYSHAWRTPANVQLMANAINHINDIMPGDLSLGISSTFVLKQGSRYIGALWALAHPITPFTNPPQPSFFRRLLTEIAMLGAGRRVGIIKKSADNLEEALAVDGVLRLNAKPTKYAYAYGEIGLEPNHRKKTAKDCDTTFWAVQFLSLVDGIDDK